MRDSSEDWIKRLHQAARSGNQYRVWTLLHGPARAEVSRVLNSRDVHGTTALQKAIEHGHEKAALWLLRSGAEVEDDSAAPACEDMRHILELHRLTSGVRPDPDGLFAAALRLDEQAFREVPIEALYRKDAQGRTAAVAVAGAVPNAFNPMAPEFRRRQYACMEVLIWRAPAVLATPDHDGMNATHHARVLGHEHLLDLMERAARSNRLVANAWAATVGPLAGSPGVERTGSKTEDAFRSQLPGWRQILSEASRPAGDLQAARAQHQLC